MVSEVGQGKKVGGKQAEIRNQKLKCLCSQESSLNELSEPQVKRGSTRGFGPPKGIAQFL